MVRSKPLMKPHPVLWFLLLPFGIMLNTAVAFADTPYSPPTIRGKKIDRCLKDGRGNACFGGATRTVANFFCEEKGHPEGARDFTIDTRNRIPMGVFRAASSFSGSLQFFSTTGVHTFTQIICKSEEETRRFSRPVRNGMRIDRCVQGADWGFTDPYRCDAKRRRQIAKKYCLARGFQDQLSYKLESHMSNHAVLTFRRGTNFNNGVWAQVVGGDAFKEITCKR